MPASPRHRPVTGCFGMEAIWGAARRSAMPGRSAPVRFALVLALSAPVAAPSAASDAGRTSGSGETAGIAAVGAHATARLLDGGRAGPDDAAPAGARLAGVRIDLDPPFITYWRDPGEAGVPPSFDASASDNVASVAIRYPAPETIDEAGTTAFGYRHGVTFPVVVTARDPARPVALDLRVDYAVCADLCLPARAHLRATLDDAVPSPGAAATADAAAVRAALATVPQPRNVGDGGPVRIEAVTVAEPAAAVGAAGLPAAALPDEPAFTVEAATPDGTGSLYAEAPEGWYLQSKPARTRDGGGLAFPVVVLQAPPGGRLPGTVRLTLVSPAGAIEVPVDLDGSRPNP